MLTLFVTIIFILRRTTFLINRFNKPELKGFPAKDALTILTFELILITCIFLMNGADSAIRIKELGQGYGFIIGDIIGSMLTVCQLAH